MQDIFNDQQSISTFATKINDFLAKLDFGGGDEEEEEAAGDGEEEGGGLAIDNSNVFKLDPKLEQATGGPMPSPHEPDPSKMGKFIY